MTIRTTYRHSTIRKEVRKADGVKPVFVDQYRFRGRIFRKRDVRGVPPS